MGELQQLHYHPSDLQTPAAAPPQSAQSETSDDPPPPPSSSTGNEPFPPQPLFDPSRMIGIIRRKALIKDLAAVYHAECLTYCQELLEVQKKLEEPPKLKIVENTRKEPMRPPKRLKKSR